MDFLERTRAESSFKKGKLTLSATVEEPHTYATTFAKHAAFTVFPEGKVGRSPQLKQRKEQSSDGKTSEIPDLKRLPKDISMANASHRKVTVMPRRNRG